MRNRKHYCDDCGKLLGSDGSGWSCHTEKDGKNVCWECHQLRYEQENLDEEKLLRKQQQKDGFGDIPYKTYWYCSHDNKEIDTHVERIPIDALKDYSTSCGSVPNSPFVPKVRDFIKAHSGKNFVIAEVYNGEKTIQSLAVHWKGNKRTFYSNTDKFSDMISDNEGSLRAEQCFEDGWDTYESE